IGRLPPGPSQDCTWAPKPPFCSAATRPLRSWYCVFARTALMARGRAAASTPPNPPLRLSNRPMLHPRERATPPPAGSKARQQAKSNAGACTRASRHTLSLARGAKIRSLFGERARHARRGARRDQAKTGDRGESERDQHIVTGKRQSEKTPRGLVTAHDVN